MRMMRTFAVVSAVVLFAGGCTINTGGSDDGGSDTSISNEDSYAILEVVWDAYPPSEKAELCDFWSEESLRDTMVNSFVEGYMSTGPDDGLSPSDLESLVRRLMGEKC